MTEVESFVLKSDRKFLNYIPNENSPLTVYMYDTLTSQWITMSPSLGLNLFDKTHYAYIEDISCVLFHPSLLNTQIKIEYEHNGIKNPFLIHETLNLIDRMLELSKNKISESVYIKESKLGEYTLEVNGGTVLYNGEVYVIPEHDINFRFLGLPTVIGQYYGYLLYIGSDTLNHNLYKPLKYIKPTIVRTNFVYKEDQFSQAKAELLQQARSNLLNENDPLLEIAYIFISIAKDTQDGYTMIYQVDYPLIHRKI